MNQAIFHAFQGYDAVPYPTVLPQQARVHQPTNIRLFAVVFFVDLPHIKHRQYLDHLHDRRFRDGHRVEIMGVFKDEVIHRHKPIQTVVVFAEIPENRTK